MRQKDTAWLSVTGSDSTVLLTFIDQNFLRGHGRRSVIDDDLELRNMAIHADFSGRQSPFEKVLDQLEEDDSRERAAAVGVERFWPGAWSGTPTENYRQDSAVESLYAESLDENEVAAAELPPPPPDVAEIRRELAASRSLDDLRRLRRRCALAAHPDRVRDAERPQAEKLMAEINAAIDRAIKERLAVAKRK